MRRLLFAVLLSLSMAACSPLKTHTDVEALKEAKAVGSPFTQQLTGFYKEIVNSKQRAMDYPDAKHFAKKGLLAAEGKVVLPEPLENWHLDADSAKMLRQARIDLVGDLNAGARVIAPFEAATAQGKFDCWIEQQEQNWMSFKPASCKAEFEKAIRALDARMRAAHPHSEKIGKPVPSTKKAAPVAVAEEVDPSAMKAEMDEGMFVVFFDFDRATLNASGQSVLDSIAAQAKKRKDLHGVTIIGHTDTSGSPAYNQKLSQRRADAVKAALQAKGVEGSLLQSGGRGESELMVPTANNTREPANRRAEIRFE